MSNNHISATITIYTVAELTVKGLTRNGNKRRAMIIWKNGDLFYGISGYGMSYNMVKEAMLRPDIAHDVNIGHAVLVDIGQIYSTPSELRRLVSACASAPMGARAKA